MLWCPVAIILVVEDVESSSLVWLVSKIESSLNEITLGDFGCLTRRYIRESKPRLCSSLASRQLEVVRSPDIQLIMQPVITEAGLRILRTSNVQSTTITANQSR